MIVPIYYFIQSKIERLESEKSKSKKIIKSIWLINDLWFTNVNFFLIMLYNASMLLKMFSNSLIKFMIFLFSMLK